MALITSTKRITNGNVVLRRNTLANWTSQNPVLLNGEHVLITDTKQTKIGDGVTPFNDIPVIGGLTLGVTNETAFRGDYGKTIYDIVMAATTEAVANTLVKRDSNGKITEAVEIAKTLETARSITLSGAVTGSASFNGSANVTITTTKNANQATRGTFYINNAIGSDSNSGLTATLPFKTFRGMITKYPELTNATVYMGSDYTGNITINDGWQCTYNGTAYTDAVISSKLTDLTIIGGGFTVTGAVKISDLNTCTISALTISNTAANTSDKNAAMYCKNCSSMSLTSLTIATTATKNCIITNNCNGYIINSTFTGLAGINSNYSFLYVGTITGTANVSYLVCANNGSIVFIDQIYACGILLFTMSRSIVVVDGVIQNTIENAKLADAATKLLNARTIAISGGATGTATSFNGTANITIPITALDPTKITGTTPITKGGTGASTIAAARTNLGIESVDGVSFTGGSNITHYNSCTTAGDIAEKTVSIAGFTLAFGSRAIINFANANTAETPTLNISGTGAKNIYHNGELLDATKIIANSTFEFVYNGESYDVVGGIGTGGGGGSGIIIGTVAPEDTSLQWIDTNGVRGILKYYNEATLSWVAIASTWG